MTPTVCTIELDQNSNGVNRVNRFRIPLWQRILTHYVWTFPLLCAFMYPFFCFSIYFAALYYGHVEPILPYISDAGSMTPEAGYFAQIMDISAILICTTGFIRYKQIKYYLAEIAQQHKSSAKSIYRLSAINFRALACLYLNGIGMVVVGNFRATEATLNHFIGVFALVGIVLSIGYMIYLCSYLSREYSIESPPTTMTIGLTIGFINALVCFATTFYSFYETNFKSSETEYRLHWTSDKPGYGWHLVSSFSEWFTINSMAIYFMCLYRRMKNFVHWNLIWK